MKRNDFLEIKKLDEKALLAKVTQLQQEIAGLVLDKNMGNLKDLKSMFKKKKDIAQILTVVKQKQLLSLLEGPDKKSEELKGEKEN